MYEIGLALSVLIGVSLGFFGGGGSILTVPLLVYVFGLEPKPAIASSLVIVGAASVVGAIHHWRMGNVELRTEGIERITASSIVTRDGREHEIDVLILTTGY